MAKITTFDVLIVYSAKIALSASSQSAITPFAKGSVNESYNIVYSYFLEICHKYNLKAAFTTSADIIGSGTVCSYWLVNNKKWLKKGNTAFSKLIFDKFSPTREKIKVGRNLLFSSSRVRSFNSPYIFNLCFDKQKTHTKLRNFSIPTVTISDKTLEGLDKACKILVVRIARHPNKEDFSEEVVVKDRFGSGGRNVYKFNPSESAKMTSIIDRHKRVSFIIQPFVKFDKGFSYQTSLVSADIRLIYFGRRLIQTYIRMAKVGDFRCNEHQGGSLKYIPKSFVPAKVVNFSRNITKILDEKSSLYALDFIVSNAGNVYLLEANTGPGLDWNLSIKENEVEAKKLIRFIVKELVKRVNPPKATSKKESPKVSLDTPLLVDDYPQITL